MHICTFLQNLICKRQAVLEGYVVYVIISRCTSITNPITNLPFGFHTLFSKPFPQHWFFIIIYFSSCFILSCNSVGSCDINWWFMSKTNWMQDLFAYLRWIFLIYFFSLSRCRKFTIITIEFCITIVMGWSKKYMKEYDYLRRDFFKSYIRNEGHKKKSFEAGRVYQQKPDTDYTENCN